jgi:Xaa-Pro aminopeptidase
MGVCGRSGLAAFFAGLLTLVFLCASAQARVREPNSVYAERRARLRAQMDGPVVLFGYTGREDSSPSYVFHQEDSFYYLTGHIEPGAALVLVPENENGKSWDGAREILFLPPRDAVRERWEVPRMAPGDPDVA